eukprot:2850336-Amphidinium_carterae.1
MALKVENEARCQQQRSLVCETIRAFQQAVKVQSKQAWLVLPYGSCVSGYSTKIAAALDMLLIPYDKPSDDVIPEATIKDLEKALEGLGRGFRIVSFDGSNVWQIRHQERDLEEGLDVWLRVSNRLHANPLLRSFQLQKAYKDVHPIVADLVQHVKIWAAGELQAETMAHF